MFLKIETFSRILKDTAPKFLCESYDNVGLMVGEKTCEITNILVALDCSLKTIDEAIEKNCNLIFTHHPLIFNKPSTINDSTLQGKKILKLVKNGINVYSMHTNLDSVRGGINDIFAQLMGINECKVIDPKMIFDDDKCAKFAPAGIGRIGKLKGETTLKELCAKIKENLEIEHLRYCGDLNMKISKLAVINGSGMDYFKAAVKYGAECIITGDTTYHPVQEMSESNIGVIDAGHFETEWMPFKIFCLHLSDKLKELEYDNKIILSDKCKPVYKYI